MIKRYLLYLIRWQMSTPILAICLAFLHFGVTWNTVIANLVGGIIFFWLDMYIFTSRNLNPLWEIKEDGTCYDCKFKGRVFRLVKAINYDRTNDKHPQFRCSECSGKKIQQLLEKGVIL